MPGLGPYFFKSRIKRILIPTVFNLRPQEEMQ